MNLISTTSRLTEYVFRQARSHYHKTEYDMTGEARGILRMVSHCATPSYQIIAVMEHGGGKNPSPTIAKSLDVLEQNNYVLLLGDQVFITNAGLKVLARESSFAE